jgi:hypothetical protein
MSETEVPAPAPEPKPIPILPDPVSQINQYDLALKSLADEERRLRDELAVKDPLESTADTLAFAHDLLLIMQAIDKIKMERGAAIRRLARGF